MYSCAHAQHVKTTKDNDVTNELTTLARDVLTDFVESGYSQWFMNLEYNRLPEDQDLFITEVRFEEYDEGTMTPVEPRRVFTITETKVIKAMRKIAMEAVDIRSDLRDRIKEALHDENYANLDAETDDCIVQVAAFGELVYG